MKKKILFIICILLLLLFSIYFLGTNNNESSSEWKINKKEYPLDEYTLKNLPVSHKSANEVRQFFEDSDINHDEKLKGQEINEFDYKIKHSQYTFNGPYGYN